jgi:hypothetical protein
MDKSPLTNPAGFVRVPAGTVATEKALLMTLGGRPYRVLETRDSYGRLRLYVYADAMGGWGRVR